MAADSQHISAYNERRAPEGPFAEASFLVVHCETCEREVLTARDLDEDGQLIDVCMHCDSGVDRHAPSARWLDAAALTECGYFVEGSETVDDRHGGGGCRGGSCGVQQPDQ